MKAMKVLMVAILAGGMLSSPLLAQPPKEKRVRERIQMLRMWKLTEELDLTEKEAAELFPIFGKYEKKRAKLHHQRRRLLDKLRGLIQKGAPPERINEVIRKLEANYRELSRMREEEWEEVKRVLTPDQQARYILFHERFARDMWRMIQKKRKKGEEWR
ncbi:MAG: hypothetical protein DRG40_05435 [Deltaproteobacteria bacterium]|nr:MAG: hypothetical protein DRG40_05435 [Deltaproteobacteria bacterium]